MGGGAGRDDGIIRYLRLFSCLLQQGAARNSRSSDGVCHPLISLSLLPQFESQLAEILEEKKSGGPGQIKAYVRFLRCLKHRTTEMPFIPTTTAFPLLAGTLHGETALNFQHLSRVPLSPTPTALSFFSLPPSRHGAKSCQAQPEHQDASTFTMFSMLLE